MSKRRMQFPMLIRTGAVVVKIYKVQNEVRDAFTISYFAACKRKLKMFTSFDEAHAEATSKATSLSKGELDVLHLGNAERIAYVPLRKLKAIPMVLRFFSVDRGGQLPSTG